jgi:hypothetical protein
MSTQRRENHSTPATKTYRRGPRNHWQRISCTERGVPSRRFVPDGVQSGVPSRRFMPDGVQSAGASGQASLAPAPRHGRAYANGGTAPPATPAWLATNSLQLDHRTIQLVRFVQLVRKDIRHGSRSSPPLGAGSRAATGTPATQRSSLLHIPFPPGFARLHPTLPRFPAGNCRWTERYDGKRDLHLQHAA